MLCHAQDRLLDGLVQRDLCRYVVRLRFLSRADATGASDGGRARDRMDAPRCLHESSSSAPAVARERSQRGTLRPVGAWQGFVDWAVVPLQLTTFSGLVLKGRARRVWLLPVFLVVATCVRLLQLLGANAFRGWHAWVWLELLLKSLLVGVVVEITARVFARLPGAAPWAWRGLALVTLATVASIGWALAEHSSGREPWVYVTVTQIMPRVAFGAAALCVATLIVVVIYGVPLDSLHACVLFGVALYLSLYAGPLGSAADHSKARFMIYHVTPLVYVAILALWTYAAWRRERNPTDPVLQRLQPWL